MRKILLILTVLLFIPLMAGCDNHTLLKTEFAKGEEAFIDDVTVLLEDAEYNDTYQLLTLSFQITNHRDNTMTLVPDQNFVLYDINQVQISNQYHNDTNILKKNETTHYTLEYSISKKEIYNILFYSGIVENNIKFVLTSPDIRVVS